MNMIKKLISIILCFTFIAVPLSASSDSTSDADAKTAYDFLMAVGAMDKEEVEFNAQMPVTRAHFVKLALFASNDAPKVLVSDAEVFSDVTPATQYEAYIETAHRLKIISGSGGDNFNPEEIITLSQALKIVVNILGYAHVAELSGGYPSGYYAIASKLDILSGVTLDSSQNVTFGDAVRLLSDALKADIMEVVGYGDNLEFEARDGKSLLSERHGVSYEEGIIAASSYTRLYHYDSGLEKNQIEINDILYDTSLVPDAHNMLGRDVVLWYDNSNDTQIKNALFIESGENDFTVGCDIKDIEPDGDNVTVYSDDGNAKTVRLTDGVTYILNKKMAVMTNQDISDLNRGNVLLISNDGDKTVDVVMITSYDSYTLTGIDAANGIIVTNDGTTFELSDESDNCTFDICKNGNPASLFDLKSGDSILVSSPEQVGFYHVSVLASDTCVNGSFDEIGDDYAVINNVKYNLDERIDVTAGKKYTVLIDALGGICSVEAANDYVYGYLYAIAKEGMDSAKCRIFTENNRWVDLYFANKVKYSGGSDYQLEKLLSDEVYAELESIGDNMRQLVRYNVNSDAEIISLEFADNYNAEDESFSEAVKNDVFRTIGSQDLSFRSANTFDGKFYVDINTKVFNIPSDYEKTKFRVKKITSFTNDKKYTVTAYDMDEIFSCPVMTLENSDTEELSVSDRFMIVTGKGEKFNSLGEVMPSVVGYRNALKISFPVDVSQGGVIVDTYNNLKSGDLVILKFDDNDNVCDISVYDMNEKYYLHGSMWSLLTIIGGKVLKNDAETQRLKLEYSVGGSQIAAMTNSSTAVYIWDKSDESYTFSSVDAILPGDCIYAKMKYLTCDEIMVIRE